MIDRADRPLDRYSGPELAPQLASFITCNRSLILSDRQDLHLENERLIS